MDSQKGALYDDDSRNRGDEYFIDKSQGSKTANASSLDTSVSDSSNGANGANGEGVELVTGRCRARSRARKYDSRWVICMGPHTCKRAGYKDKREKGVVRKPCFYVAVYTRVGGVTMLVSSRRHSDE
jgi:hypothetical protein